jgi:hypothetical protein
MYQVLGLTFVGLLNAVAICILSDDSHTNIFKFPQRETHFTWNVLMDAIQTLSFFLSYMAVEIPLILSGYKIFLIAHILGQ